MFNLFTKKFDCDDDLSLYIFKAIDEYVNDTDNDVDTMVIIKLITVLYKYINTKYPKNKKNIYELIQLITQLIESKNSQMSNLDIDFAAILAEDEDNYLAIEYALVKGQVDNDLIYDVLMFMSYNLIKAEDDETININKTTDKLLKKTNALLDDTIFQLSVSVDEEDEETNSVLPDELKEKIQNFVDEYKPNKIKEYLDKRIIGQHDAKRIVSISIYNHMILLLHPEKKLKKNNILMIGPSGCGKTEIMRVLSEILPVPICIFDASGMSQNGWKGDKKIKDAVKSLILKTETIEEAECGIVFLDEFDKVCRPQFTSHGENVSVHIQGELLAMIEGTEVEVNVVSEDIPGMAELVNTKNILFICAGAFDGIEKEVEKEKNKNASIGFNKATVIKNSEITAKDINKEIIIKFGVTPELAGRLTTVAVLNKLTKEDMLDILTKCENNVIDELHSLLNEGYNVKLEISNEGLSKLLEKMCMDVGARGLRSIVFDYFNDIMFDIAGRTDIEKIVVNGELKAEYVLKS